MIVPPEAFLYTPRAKFRPRSCQPCKEEGKFSAAVVEFGKRLNVAPRLEVNPYDQAPLGLDVVDQSEKGSNVAASATERLTRIIQIPRGFVQDICLIICFILPLNEQTDQIIGST